MGCTKIKAHKMHRNCKMLERTSVKCLKWGEHPIKYLAYKPNKALFQIYFLRYILILKELFQILVQIYSFIHSN